MIACRVLLALCSICLLSAPLAAEAQKRVTIGLLSIGTDPDKPGVWPPFIERLAQLGYVEGRNMNIEWRFAGGKEERLAAFVSELARLKVDIVVVT